MRPLSGLVVGDRMVTHDTGFWHDHWALFEKIYPLPELRERAMFENQVIAWECTPPNHLDPTGEVWFLPVEEWDVCTWRFATMESIEDEALAARIREEARKWRDERVIDAGSDLVFGRSYHLVKSSGGKISHVIAEQVVGSVDEIERSNIGVVRADVRKITGSVITRLYGNVGRVSSSCILYSADSVFGSIKDSRVIGMGGKARNVENSVVGG